MDLTSLKTIKFFCHRYNIRSNRKKGQNFLIDQEVVDNIIKAADLSSHDFVLEIGSGLGVLTYELAQRVRKVVAVEMDRKMCQALEEILKNHKNVEIVEEDILKINLQFAPRGSRLWRQSIFNFQFSNKYKVVANFPYNITSAVLRKFLEASVKPELMVVMVQKEVGERICARPGQMSLLSVAVQVYGNPEIIGYVTRSSFWPQPEIDSILLKISKIQDIGYPIRDKNWFFKVVKAGFKARRKLLKNNLKNGLGIGEEKVVEALKKIGLKEKVRAQELEVEDWLRISQLFC